MSLLDEMETGLKKCEKYELMEGGQDWWSIWRLNKETMKEKGYAVTKVKGKFYILKPIDNSDL